MYGLQASVVLPIGLTENPIVFDQMALHKRNSVHLYLCLSPAACNQLVQPWVIIRLSLYSDAKLAASLNHVAACAQCSSNFGWARQVSTASPLSARYPCSV